MRPLLLGLLCLLAGVSACGDSRSDELRTQIAALCEQTRDLHNAIADAGNEMAAAEVNASPAKRAELAASALESMIAIARDATLPTDPEELTTGLALRRDMAVTDLDNELIAFRSAWPEIQQDDRGHAIAGIFVLGERLMSETEPRVLASTPDSLIEAVRSEPGCRNVIQLPRR